MLQLLLKPRSYDHKNVGPGKVECVLQGPPGDVRAIQRWLRTGPENARIDTFTVEELPPQPDLPPFQVKF